MKKLAWRAQIPSSSQVVTPSTICSRCCAIIAEAESHTDSESEEEDMYNNGRGEGYDYDPPPQQPTHNSRVKVEDALTYLDQVKTQFASEPQVYTQFLDIMKDFKSQAIDTPGVITRVSNLFAGKPHLITGFNQFLPAGFEVAIDAGKIIISEPNGLRKLIENGEVFPLPPYQDYQGMGAQPEEEDEEEDEAEDEEVEREEEEQEDEDEEMEDEEQIQEDVRVAELQRLAEREDRHRSVYQFDAEDVDPEDALYAKNTSVKFVNRIKARFHSRQHVYHKFLEILGNFQEATSSEIIDVQAEQMVLDAVAQLFGDEVDLFEEFRLFMPSMASRMNRPALVEETEPKEEEKSEPEPELMNTEVEEEASEAEDEDLEDEDEEEEETEELVGDEALLGEPEESVDDEEDEDKESSDEDELEEMEESEELKLPEGEQESGQEEPIRDDEESEGETSAVPEPAPSVSLPETELPVDKEYFYVSPSEDEVDEEEEEDETAGGEDEPEKPEEHDLTLPVEAEDEAEDEEEGDEETELDEEEIATLEKMEAEGFLQDEEEEEDIAFGELEDITSESGSDNDESDFETGELELISKKYPEHDIMGRMDELFRSMSVEDITLIEKIRRTATAAQYNVFLRAMATFNARIISGQELLALLYPVIGGCGSLLNEFNRQFIALDHSTAPAAMDCLTEEQKHNIDYASCKQLGVSYRSLPDTMEPPKCSGRTLLCHSVLNDTWVSFPSWSSEDTTVVSAKKTPYEEFVCKTEDERFELDIIIENNKYAIDALECQRRKMNRLSTHEQKQFKLDESLGGSSQTLMVKALKRIYGENATKIIDSLRNNPSLSIPKIIDRMKDKERDWIEAQEQMNKVWKEQNDRHMAKALDHLSNAMKTSDAKWIKAKQLVHQMEVLFDERQTKFVEGRSDDEGPHMMLYYPEDKTVMKDANELIIHHISKQSSISSSEKERITVVLKRLVKELFFIPYHLEDNSDDADDEDEIQEGLENMDDVKMGCSTRYRMIYGGNPLLVFMRVYHILCERLFRIKESWREMCATYEMDERLQEERKRIYTEQGSHKSLATEMNIFDMNNGLPELRSSGQKKSVPSMYEDFLMECKNFLDGGMDALIFEDQIRNLFPLEAYMAFSIDKIVNLISRQIHLLALSNDNAECLKMYERFKVNPPFSLMDNSDRRAGIEQEYANEAETKLNCQNCFKLVTMDLQKVTVTVELVDTETEDMSMDGREIIDRALSEVGSSEEEEEEEEEDKEETMEVEKKEEVEEEEEEMPEQEPEVEEAVEEAGTSMDEKEQTPEPERRVPVFLTRNARKRQQTGLTEIHKEFQQFYGTFSVTTERTRMVSNTREGFLKITRPFGKEKKHMLDEVCKRRKLRVEGAITMSNLAGATTWLDTNSSRTVMTNPTYPFLQFNQYHLEDYAL